MEKARLENFKVAALISASGTQGNPEPKPDWKKLADEKVPENNLFYHKQKLKAQMHQPIAHLRKKVGEVTDRFGLGLMISVVG